MEDERHGASSQEEKSELIVSDDSQYVGAMDKAVDNKDRPPISPPSSETLSTSAQGPFSSNDLIPHPTTAPPLRGITRILGATDRGSTVEQPSGLTLAEQPGGIPLTAEIYASGAIPPGTMLGHFTIKSYIGGGGMGRVYLATDTALDRHVAVKVLPRQRANDQGTVARFMNEARSAARLNHEHIAQVYFAGEQDGIPYIVFEYVEGTNIRQLVDDFDAFPLPQALNYLIQIAHALAHAGTHGVVHRDVKPSNILITREGRAKLIDMGLARLLDPSQTRDDLTASGVTLGTFDYISPEQARDPRNADIRSDIYSLGCTFFFMLSGRPPFPEGTVLQKLLQHQGDEPPDIRSFQPNIPVEVAQLLQRMMAKDPRQRFQTPETLIDSLIRVAKMVGLQPTGPGKLVWEMGHPTKSSQALRHIPWIVAILLLLGAYFPLGLYWNQLGRLDVPKELTNQFGNDIPDIPIPPNSTDAAVLPNGITTGVTDSAGYSASDLSDDRAPFKMQLVSSNRFDSELIARLFSGLGLSGLEFGHGTSGSRTIINGQSSNGTSANDKRGGIWHTLTAGILEPDRICLGLIPPEISGSFGMRTYSAAFDIAALLKDSQTLAPAPDPTIAKVPEKLSVFCIDPSGETAESFKTLASALLEAERGATIELKWNGVVKIDPFVLTGRELKFVAADGYRPTMLFEPADSPVGSTSSRTMVSVRSCKLEFDRIGIELGIKQDDMGLRWTLFESTGENDLRFFRCCLTIRNAAADHSAYHQEVAFFRSDAASSGLDTIPLQDLYSGNTVSQPIESGDDYYYPPIFNSPYTVLSMPDAAMEMFKNADRNAAKEAVKDKLQILLSDSLVHGEATGLHCVTPQSIVLIAENTVFALAKSFIQTEDSRRTTKPETLIQIRFDRVNYYGREALVRQHQSSYETEPLRLEFEAERSIFLLNGAPLALFRGASSSQGAFDYFQWTGSMNFYQDVSLGWRFQADSSRLDGGGVAYEMSLAEWKRKMNTKNEDDERRSTKLDQLIFEEIRKAPHQIFYRDLKPVFPPDSSLTNEEKAGIGATLSDPLLQGQGESAPFIPYRPDRRPLDSDFGRLRFE